jgi:parallel beta-helix repeat protein
MHITNSASFAIRAFGNRTRRLANVTIRNCTVDGTRAKQALSTDWTDKFTAERTVIRNVNKTGLAFDNSEMAAWKDTVSTNLRADRVIVENAVNSVGIWLDQSCVDFAITNCEIKGKTQYGVHIELCGWGVVANNTVSGDAKFVFYNKGSRNIRYWNNSFEGKAEVVFMDEQDDRAGKTSSADSRQPFISRGLDYFSRENEWVNNSSSADSASYARMMIYDDQAKTDARSIISRVAGNFLPVRAPGSTASFSLGVPLRKDFTTASASALDISKFFGNGAVASQVQQQTIPVDIAKLVD